MRKRTTLEIDEDLLDRAGRALGCTTKRATVEEALRRAIAEVEDEDAARAERQRAYLDQLADFADLDVLASESMWR